MALFFKTFRHNTVASAMGIPVFPLSKNELKHQAKYEDDVFSMGTNSADGSSFLEACKGLNKFAKMDRNRSLRQSILCMPPNLIIPDDMKKTEKRSNLHEEEQQEKPKIVVPKKKRPSPEKRSKSEVDEVQLCLNLAKEDFKFDMKTFFRKESGELIAKVPNEPKTSGGVRSSLIIRKVLQPMKICDSTKLDLGKVHYQLAVLHGIGRFPEVVPDYHDSNDDDPPNHDVFSVLFHLSHAASLRCAPACLALGRLLAGLGTSNFLPVDFEAAKDLLKRAMDSNFPPNAPKLAAGCLLYQIYLDENKIAREGTNNNDGDDGEQQWVGVSVISDLVLMNLLEDILDLISACDAERESNDEFKVRKAAGSTHAFHVGDRVEGNYALEGNYYAGIVDAVSEDGSIVDVKYDDDGTIESLSKVNRCQKNMCD